MTLEILPRISVGTAIAHAYGFLFRKFVSILGFVWAPIALYAAGFWFLIPKIFSEFAAETQTGRTTALHWNELSLVGVVLAAFILLAVAAVSATRLAMGIEKERFLVHFTIGGRELRLFFAMIRFTILLAVVMLAIGCLVGFGLWALDHFGVTEFSVTDQGLLYASEGQKLLVAIVAMTLAIIILVSVFAFTAVRAGSMLMSVATVEEHASLKRVWALNRGHFWALLLIGLSILIPVAVVRIGLQAFVLGSDFPVLTQLTGTQAQQLPEFARILEAHAAGLALTQGFGAFLFVALTAGASAYLYGALVDGAPRLVAERLPVFSKTEPLFPIIPNIDLGATEAQEAADLPPHDEADTTIADPFSEHQEVSVTGETHSEWTSTHDTPQEHVPPEFAAKEVNDAADEHPVEQEYAPVIASDAAVDVTAEAEHSATTSQEPVHEEIAPPPMPKSQVNAIAPAAAEIASISNAPEVSANEANETGHEHPVEQENAPVIAAMRRWM